MISMTQTDKITTWRNGILDTASTQPSYGFYSANIWLMILPPCGHHTATIEAVKCKCRALYSSVSPKVLYFGTVPTRKIKVSIGGIV